MAALLATPSCCPALAAMLIAPSARTLHFLPAAPSSSERLPEVGCDVGLERGVALEVDWLGGGGDGRASEGDETVLMPAGRNDSRSSEADAAKPCQAQVQNLILTCRRQACESVCRQWQ